MLYDINKHTHTHTCIHTYAGAHTPTKESRNTHEEYVVYVSCIGRCPGESSLRRRCERLNCVLHSHSFHRQSHSHSNRHSHSHRHRHRH